MGSKFFDIPFRRLSADSDFACRDGEILSAVNADISDSADPSSSSEILPPSPEVDFAIVRTTLPGWHIHPDVYPSKTLAATTPSLEYWTPLATRLPLQFYNDASLYNLFVSPFYAVSAWKSVSGEYLATSAPVLLIPNSRAPVVAADADIDKTEVEFRIAGAVCGLYFKMKAPEVLRDFVGKIRMLEILVSEPLHVYDSYHSVPERRATTDSFCRVLDIDTGIISNHVICNEVMPIAWKQNVNVVANVESDDTEGLDKVKFYPFARIPLSEVDIMTGWTPVSTSSPGLEIVHGGSASGVEYKKLSEGLAGASASSKYISVIGIGEDIDVSTRPLKLSGSGEWKRGIRVFLRGNYTRANLTIEVYGSRDMIQWWCVARRTGGSVAGLPQTYFRFYRIRIKGRLERGESLEGVNIIHNA